MKFVPSVVWFGHSRSYHVYWVPAANVQAPWLPEPSLERWGGLFSAAFQKGAPDPRDRTLKVTCPVEKTECYQPLVQN